MKKNALEKFVDGVRSVWGPLNSEVVASCRQQLEALVKAPDSEAWLAALHREAPLSEELIRDLDHGFMLLAHTEHAGLYRPPHDHGRAWVIYAIQRGEIEMGTYARVEDESGEVKLVKRNATILRAGDVQVYLPGDIHDTRCLSGPALLFRFTERDLKKEDKEEHRVTRYAEQKGVLTPKAS
jgi:hypothetical protein